jgi:multidrug efflux pump subunit AcrB
LHKEDIDKIKCIRIGFDDDENVVLSTLSDIIEKNNPVIIKKGEESRYATIS